MCPRMASEMVGSADHGLGTTALNSSWWSPNCIQVENNVYSKMGASKVFCAEMRICLVGKDWFSLTEATNASLKSLP
jgi:hypothetical protein